MNAARHAYETERRDRQLAAPPALGAPYFYDAERAERSRIIAESQEIGLARGPWGRPVTRGKWGKLQRSIGREANLLRLERSLERRNARLHSTLTRWR